MTLDYLIYDDNGNPIEKKFLFDGFIFNAYLNYISISTKENNSISIPSPLCGFKTLNSLAKIYEGRSSVLGFNIEVKKIENGATLFLIDNSDFKDSNKNPSFVGGIIQDVFESPSEYLMRHKLSTIDDGHWHFLNENKKLVNLKTEETIKLIDQPLRLGIRETCLDQYHNWIIDEFGKNELSWFNKWGEKLILVNTFK